MMKPDKLVRCALIAAVYAAVCLALPFLSYGPVQIRFSEALTLLPVLMPEAVVGLTLGCFLANLIGVFMGTTMAVDVVFGTLATLLAALVTHRLASVRIKGLPLPGMLPPVLFNALIVGAELTWLYSPQFTAALFGFNALTVGLGELVACLLGVALVFVIERNPALKNRFTGA